MSSVNTTKQIQRDTREIWEVLCVSPLDGHDDIMGKCMCSNSQIAHIKERCTCAKLLQLCRTLCDPMECSLPWTLQARILEWVTHALLQGIFQTLCLLGLPALADRFFITSATFVVQSLSHVLLFVTTRTAASQASVSVTSSQSLLKLTSIESVMPSNHLFASGGQSIGVSASASVLPVNIQG